MSKKTLKLSDIQKTLTREMYREKFHKLLFWEENEHETILKERSVMSIIIMFLFTYVEIEILTVDRFSHNYITSVSMFIKN